MPLIAFAYLALGLAYQCILFGTHADWSQGEPWLHILLWPGYLAMGVNDAVHAALASVSWLAVVLAGLVFAPLATVWLARRGRLRQQLHASAPEAAPPAAETTRERIEPRLAPRRAGNWLSRSRQAARTPIGQLTPVPPRPQ